jgi:hypothetical protein
MPSVMPLCLGCHSSIIVIPATRPGMLCCFYRCQSLSLGMVWLGMKTNENRRKTASPVFVSAFYHRKRDRIRNSRERKRKRDKRNYENEQKQKY